MNNDDQAKPGDSYAENINAFVRRCQQKYIKFEENIKEDSVNHPTHYTQHPSGIECITITEHMCFNLGNAVKYIWRADLKGKSIEDLKKARWYIDREINKREEHE